MSGSGLKSALRSSSKSVGIIDSAVAEGNHDVQLTVPDLKKVISLLLFCNIALTQFFSLSFKACADFLG